MKKNNLIKHSSTLAIIASGVSCLLCLVLPIENGETFLKYYKIQSIFFCIPMILMFCNVKRLAKKEFYSKSLIVCSAIGQLLLTIVSVFITIDSINSLDYETTAFGITFIANIIALVILVNVLLIIGFVKSKQKESN